MSLKRTSEYRWSVNMQQYKWIIASKRQIDRTKETRFTFVLPFLSDILPHGTEISEVAASTRSARNSAKYSADQVVVLIEKRVKK